MLDKTICALYIKDFIGAHFSVNRSRADLDFTYCEICLAEEHKIEQIP